MVPSDQNAAEGRSSQDIYLFAFISGLVAACHAGKLEPSQEMQSARGTGTEVGCRGDSKGCDRRAGCTASDTPREIQLPPRARIQVDDRVFSLAYVHVKLPTTVHPGIHSPPLNDTPIVEPADWNNRWGYRLDILLAGFLERGEFNRRASFIREGRRVPVQPDTYEKPGSQCL
jgi:hypothetical protein